MWLTPSDLSFLPVNTTKTFGGHLQAAAAPHTAWGPPSNNLKPNELLYRKENHVRDESGSEEESRPVVLILALLLL